MVWTAYQFPVVHQRRDVAAGNRETVYQLTVPSGCTGFISAVANNYFDGVKWYWYIDGAAVEPKAIERQLGLVNNPKRYDPPLVVKSVILVEAYNGASETASLEWMCDGNIYGQSDV
jgi:hypothetical protein